MILAHGLLNPALRATFFVACAIVTWVVYWKIVSPRYPRLSRVWELAAWVFLLILGVASLATMVWVPDVVDDDDQAVLAWLGMNSSLGALVVCFTCWVLNRKPSHDTTTSVPVPCLGRATVIAAIGALAWCGIWVFLAALEEPLILQRRSSGLGYFLACLIVGVVSWLFLMSAVTATLLPTKFGKATVVTILFSVIGAVVVGMVLVVLSTCCSAFG